MLLSLAYTLADLDDILPPGSYRLDLVDEDGESLGVTIPITVGMYRNAAPDDNDDDGTGPPDEKLGSLSTGTGSDVRFLLEANVRSTQLAFQHNERTLTAGLRMADTLREGVQALAETQAEMIKALVGARGFPRNGWVPAHAAQQLPAKTDEADGDDEENDEPEPDKTDRMMEFVTTVGTLANNILAQFKQASTTNEPNSKKPSGLDLRSLVDWKHAAKQGNAERDESAKAPHAGLGSVLASLPPAVMMKLVEVRKHLEPDEQDRLMKLVTSIPQDELPALAATLAEMPTEELVARLRSELSNPAWGK